MSGKMMNSHTCFRKKHGTGAGVARHRESPLDFAEFAIFA
jgi:hypothetical protein